MNEHEEKIKSIAYSFACFMKDVYSYKEDYSAKDLLEAWECMKKDEDEIIKIFKFYFKDNQKFISFCRQVLIQLQTEAENAE